MFDIRDKVVVITGGTGVLGRAIAAHLAEEGAKVVILGRKAEVGNARWPKSRLRAARPCS